MMVLIDMEYEVYEKFKIDLVITLLAFEQFFLNVSFDLHRNPSI